MSDNAPIYDKINGLADRVTRIEERSAARTDEVGRLERRIARIELALITLGVGGVYVVIKQITQSAGIPL